MRSRSPPRGCKVRRRGTWRLGLALLAPLLVAGEDRCGRHLEYEIRPEGRMVHRRFTEGETVRSGTYGPLAPPESGAGWALAHLETTLGTASTYAERFGGDPDQAAMLARLRADLEWTMQRIAGWITYELAGHRDAERLRAFLLTEARADLENALLIIYAYTFGASTADSPRDRDQEKAAAVRLLLLLVERGYLDLDEALHVTAGREPDLAAVVRGRLAREMGIDPRADALPLLPFLESDRVALRSLDAYRRATEIPDTSRVAEGSSWLYLLADELWRTPGWFVPRLGPDFSVHLFLPVEPHATNGAWSARLGAVEWLRRSVSDDGEPLLVYAAWSMPDRDFQRARFGKVALEGEALFKYAIWRSGLDREHGEEWDAFLAGLVPGPLLWQRVEAWRFHDDPPAKVGGSLADRARFLLKARLGPARPADKALRHRPTSTPAATPDPPPRP